MPIYKKVNKGFFKKWSPDMAYVLGFFAADGSMIRNNRGAHFIEFSTCDKETLEQIRDVLDSNHKISTRNRIRKEWRIQYRLQIGSKMIFNDLIKLGFTPNKTKTLALPDVPNNFFGDFVRGYFDGDGNVHFKKYYVKARNKEKWTFSSGFTSGCKNFLENLHLALKKNGIKGGFVVQKSNQRGFELTLSRHDSLALYNLMYNNSVCSLRMERKKRVFEKAIKTLGYDKMRW